MVATIIALVFALGADLDAQASRTWKVREAARKRVELVPAMYSPAAFLRLKHRDAQVRQQAEVAVAAWRRWDNDFSRGLPGNKYPWLDMLTPHRFWATEKEEPPLFWGLPSGQSTGEDIVSHFLHAAPDLSNAGSPEWSRYRHATESYVRELLRLEVDRSQIRAMLHRMVELEKLYTSRVLKK